MKLEQYIKEINECPLEIIKPKDKDGLFHWKHTLEYGLYFKDYALLLAMPFEETVRLFERDNEYILRELIEYQDNRHRLFEQKEGPLSIFITPEMSTWNDYIKEYFDKIKKYFHSSIQVDIKKNVAEGYNPWYNPYTMISMVDFITRIARFAQENKALLCLPESGGWNHGKDLSRIVCYDPKGMITKENNKE